MVSSGHAARINLFQLIFLPLNLFTQDSESQDEEPNHHGLGHGSFYLEKSTDNPHRSYAMEEEIFPLRKSEWYCKKKKKVNNKWPKHKKMPTTFTGLQFCSSPIFSWFHLNSCVLQLAMWSLIFSFSSLTCYLISLTFSLVLKEVYLLSNIIHLLHWQA